MARNDDIYDYFKGNRQDIVNEIDRLRMDPDKLPNLFMSEHVPRSILRSVLPDMIQLRSIFPETVDSIIGLRSTHWVPPARGGGAFGPGGSMPDWMVRLGLHPHVSMMSGHPGELTRYPTGDWGRPTMYEAATEMEPSPPQFSKLRFEGQIPYDLYYKTGRPLEEQMFGPENIDLRNIHPKVARRLRAMANAPDFPKANPSQRIAEQLVSDALVSRMREERPTGLVDLLKAVGYDKNPQEEAGGGPLPRNHPYYRAMDELKRRIAHIYSQAGTRHSNVADTRGWNPLTEEADYREFLRRPIDEGGASDTHASSIFNRMRRDQFTGGTPKMMDALDMMQREGVYDDFLGQRFTSAAAAARNPTNMEIQKIINENVGFGEGKMAGRAGVGALLGVAGLGAAALGGPKIAKAVDRANIGAMIGGAPGAALGLISSFL